MVFDAYAKQYVFFSSSSSAMFMPGKKLLARLLWCTLEMRGDNFQGRVVNRTMIMNLFINLFIKCHLPLSTYYITLLLTLTLSRSPSILFLQIIAISCAAFHVFRFILRICVFAIFTAYLLTINVNVRSVCNAQTQAHIHSYIRTLARFNLRYNPLHNESTEIMIIKRASEWVSEQSVYR